MSRQDAQRKGFAMLASGKGRYSVRFAQDDADILAAQRLRWLCFLGQRGLDPARDGRDADDFDAACTHVLVHDDRSGTLVCCFRILPLTGREIARSYSAQFYNLHRLETYDGKMVEMGRFCIHPAHKDPAILRLAWAEMSRYVEDEGVGMLFGCSSFMGADPKTHADALAMLRERHLAPKRWLPRVKAPDVFRFARALRRRKPDAKAAMLGMPPLLRSYLLMGGWVSDHAVVDRQLDTIHVFTGLEISAIPPARVKLMRGAA